MTEDKSDLLDTLRINRKEPPPVESGATVRSRWPHWSVTLPGVPLLALLGWLGWNAIADKAVPVHVAVVRPVPGTATAAARSSLLDASGYVVARREATVGPKVAGKLHDVLVEEGVHVDEGQAIAHLDDSNTLAALGQAMASVEQAETAETDARPVFERSRSQFEKGLISGEAWDNARAQFDQTRSATKLARAALVVATRNEEDTVVKAPFAGVVTVKAAQAGEIISPLSAGAGFTRTGIATIVDMDSLEGEVDVNENYINRVRPEQRCELTLNAYPDWRVPGHVIAIVPTADRTKATVKVRVGLDAKDPRILPEMGVHVAFLSESKITAQAESPTGVTVPVGAIVTEVRGDGIVYVVRNGRAERREVKLGQKLSDAQVVLSGLSAGETVAIAGVGDLKDGTKVKIDQQP